MAEQIGVIRYRGKIGNVVGYVSRGKNLVRKAPEATAEAVSPAQKKQRDRFSEIASVAKAINSWDKQYLGHALKVSAYNNVLSYNAAYLRKDEADPASIRLPHSFFGEAMSASEISLSGRKLSFTLPDFPEGEGEKVSEVLAVVYVPLSPDEKSSKTSSETRAFSKVFTSSGAKSLEIPLELTKGDKVFLYLQKGDGAASLSPSSVAKIDVEA